ncbi:MAG: hypothetical protein ACTSQ7_04980, partial [Alphaproteobacteria bacterium]
LENNIELKPENSALSPKFAKIPCFFLFIRAFGHADPRDGFAPDSPHHHQVRGFPKYRRLVPADHSVRRGDPEYSRLWIDRDGIDLPGLDVGQPPPSDQWKM